MQLLNSEKETIISYYNDDIISIYFPALILVSVW